MNPKLAQRLGKYKLFLILVLFLPAGTGWALDTPLPSPDSPGSLFIREKVADFRKFHKAFQGLKAEFKANGFSNYSLHRSLRNPGMLILVLSCADLAKGLEFIHSKAYRTAMDRAGVGEALVWSGVDVLPRSYDHLPPKPAGIVIARNELVSYVYWKAFFDAEHNPGHGGQNAHKGDGYHPNRHYLASHYSIHRGLGGNSDVAYVVHEASDLSKAPEFMDSPAMQAMKQPLGITGFHVWYGYNLEQGAF